MTRLEEVSEPATSLRMRRQSPGGIDRRLCSHHGEILDVPLIFVKVMERGDEENQHRYFAAPVSADPRLTPWDCTMLITICRLYDSYADANRVVIGLEAAGIALSETSLISNNSDTWYRTGKASNVVALRKQGASGDTATISKFEGAAVGVAIGATAATAASLVTMLALPGVGAVVGAGWLAALLGSMAIGGATGGLLGALTNAGISEEDAHVFVEGVRRGGTLVAARVSPTDVPRVEAMMNQSAVKLGERCDLYRKSGWQAFDPSAVPYTADQVRSERALHAH
jgi:hypothetical protein